MVSTARSAAERRRWALALIAAGVLHLLIPLGFFAYYAIWPPRPAPTEQEIPIEIVIEPPPKPKAPEEQPKPKPEPDDERPAYDAPSRATQEKTNRESEDKKTQAPAAKAEPSQNPGAPQQSETAAAAPAPKPGAEPPPDQTRPDPDADRMASPQSDADAEAPPPAEVQQKPSPPPAPQPPAHAPPGAPPPTDDVLPQYQFAHAATESPVVGGNADTRYFTIVYGMIRSHMREPPGARPSRGGAIVFTVDETGNLVQRRVVTPSGAPNLDMAVMAAIAEAAPYPAPPGWQSRSMRLTYGR